MHQYLQVFLSCACWVAWHFLVQLFRSGCWDPGFENDPLPKSLYVWSHQHQPKISAEQYRTTGSLETLWHHLLLEGSRPELGSGLPKVITESNANLWNRPIIIILWLSKSLTNVFSLSPWPWVTLDITPFRHMEITQLKLCIHFYGWLPTSIPPQMASVSHLD